MAKLVRIIRLNGYSYLVKYFPPCLIEWPLRCFVTVA